MIAIGVTVASDAGDPLKDKKISGCLTGIYMIEGLNSEKLVEGRPT